MDETMSRVNRERVTTEVSNEGKENADSMLACARMIIEAMERTRQRAAASTMDAAEEDEDEDASIAMWMSESPASLRKLRHEAWKRYPQT